MSCRNQEQGKFILPARSFASFRKALVEVANAEQDRVMEAAVALHAYITKPIDQGEGKPARKERLAELNKILKGPNAYRVGHFLDQAFTSIDGELNRRSSYAAAPKWDQHTRDRAALLVLPWVNQGPRKFQAPKKKDLPPVPASTTVLEGDSFTISFDPKTRTVQWFVDEGNQNVETARESALGRAFFQQLKKVEWTRGTGGYIHYSDEYAEEAAMEHGHNPVSTHTYMGPLGKQQQEMEWGPAVFQHVSRSRPRR